IKEQVVKYQNLRFDEKPDIVLQNELTIAQKSNYYFCFKSVDNQI
ncbi:32818_t:CDS:2, partial [Gigaspora margarita]